MGKSAEIPLEKRAEINVLMSEGMSQKQIASKLKISQSAVSKILKRIVNDGMFTPRPRCGRPKKDDKLLRRRRHTDSAIKHRDRSRHFGLQSNEEDPAAKLNAIEVEATLIEKAKRLRLKKERMSEEESEQTLQSLLENLGTRESSINDVSNNKENEKLRKCSTPQNYEEHMTAQPDYFVNNFLIKLEKEDLANSFNTRVEGTPFQDVDSNSSNYLIKDEPFSFDEEGMEIKVEDVRNDIMIMDDEGEIKDEIVTSVSDIDFCSRNITSDNVPDEGEIKDEIVTSVSDIDFCSRNNTSDSVPDEGEIKDEIDTSVSDITSENIPTNEIEFLHAIQVESIDEATPKTKFRKKRRTQEEIPDNLTVEILEEVLQMSKALSQKIYKIDPVFERSVRFKRDLENAMGPYKEFYKRLKSND